MNDMEKRVDQFLEDRRFRVLPETQLALITLLRAVRDEALEEGARVVREELELGRNGSLRYALTRIERLQSGRGSLGTSIASGDDQADGPTEEPRSATCAHCSNPPEPGAKPSWLLPPRREPPFTIDCLTCDGAGCEFCTCATCGGDLPCQDCGSGEG